MIEFKIFVGKKKYAEVRNLICNSLVGNPGYINSDIGVSDVLKPAGIISFWVDGGKGNRLSVTANTQLTGASFIEVPEPTILFDPDDLEEAEESHDFSGKKEGPTEEPASSSHFVPVLTPEEEEEEELDDDDSEEDPNADGSGISFSSTSEALSEDEVKDDKEVSGEDIFAEVDPESPPPSSSHRISEEDRRTMTTEDILRSYKN